eukprot:366130-Chlamydomonas_euryale.AAC.73
MGCVAAGCRASWIDHATESCRMAELGLVRWLRMYGKKGLSQMYSVLLGKKDINPLVTPACIVESLIEGGLEAGSTKYNTEKTKQMMVNLLSFLHLSGLLCFFMWGSWPSSVHLQARLLHQPISELGLHACFRILLNGVERS